MKRLSKILPFVLIAFILMACSLTNALSGGNANPAPAQKDAQVQPESSEQKGPPSQIGSDTTAQEPATSATTGDLFEDEFNTASTQWSDTLTVTTQAAGGKAGSQVSADAGKLTFKFQAKETYAYKFLETTFPADVVLETQFVALNHINNGIAIVCRANDDLTEWIEVRLTSRSKYTIYHYDKSIKEDQGKNPYEQLASGGIDVKTMYPMKDNVVRVTCSGSQLSLEINDVQVATLDGLPILSGGRAGLGAMSTDVLPIGVQFDYLSISQP